MRKQNSDMNSVSAIPLFGITHEALDFTITDNSGQSNSVRNWIHEHPLIHSVERTALTKDLGKFMLVVDREEKEEIKEFLDGLLEQIPEGQGIGQFKKPQQGGNSFHKRRVNNINNYLNKLEERVNADLLMYDNDSMHTTPPTRPRRMTISYAQATRRLSFQPETTHTTPKTGTSQSTMVTSMSTLTQTSLDEAMSKIRKETENSIEKLRNDLKLEVQSMEDQIANAVIAAIRTAPPVENMETEILESQSAQSSYQETAMTTQSLADKVDSLVNIVKLLTERVSELSEQKEIQPIKRNRPLATPPKFRLPTTSDPETSTTQRSPPTKVLRSETDMARSTTPPPNGTPTEGAREGQ
jgi:hypothetical protein